MKIIKIKEKTHEELMKQGIKGETFDQIINKLINISRENKNE